MTKACVIGHPIAHSLSPVIHNFWLKKYGIEGEYEAVDVAPENLENFLNNLKNNGYKGCNITIPHKERAWEIISNMNDFVSDDELPSKIASFMKAVNTVVINNDGKFTATNTDFLGFARNLLSYEPEFDYQNGVCFVLGAGGAAKAVIFALTSMLVQHIVISNRTLEKAQEIERIMVEEFGLGSELISVVEWEKRNDVIPHCNLLVNTTSLGMKGKSGLDIDLSGLPEESLVTDIVYNPLETNLLKEAKALGHKTVDGIGMLLHQAAPGFEGWFGKRPEVDSELKNLLLSKL